MSVEDGGALTPTALCNYLRLTDSVAEASSAAQIRKAIGNATGMERRQVVACIEAAGLEENVANYYVGSLRTKKRVYKKDCLYAALTQPLQWMAGERADIDMADES
jgi:hypothetical protein